MSRRGLLVGSGAALGLAACGESDPRRDALRARDGEAAARSLALQRTTVAFYRSAIVRRELEGDARELAQQFVGLAVLGLRRLQEAARLLPQTPPPALPRPRPASASAAPELAGKLEGLGTAALAGQAGLISSARLRQVILALEAEAGYRAAGWALASGTRTGSTDQGPLGLATGAVLLPIDFFTLRRSSARWLENHVTERGTRSALLLAAGAVLAAPPGAVSAAGREAEAEAVHLLLTVERACAGFYRTALRELALSPRVRLLATELLRQEEAHRQLLLRVARRRELALDETLRYRVPAASERAFLRQATVLEETSVGAYVGSSARVDRGDLAEAIAGIVGVEARHAAAVLMQAGRLSKRRSPTRGLTRQEVLDRLASIVVPQAEPG